MGARHTEDLATRDGNRQGSDSESHGATTATATSSPSEVVAVTAFSSSAPEVAAAIAAISNSEHAEEVRPATVVRRDGSPTTVYDAQYDTASPAAASVNCHPAQRDGCGGGGNDVNVGVKGPRSSGGGGSGGGHTAVNSVPGSRAGISEKSRNGGGGSGRNGLSRNVRNGATGGREVRPGQCVGIRGGCDGGRNGDGGFRASFHAVRSQIKKGGSGGGSGGGGCIDNDRSMFRPSYHTPRRTGGDGGGGQLCFVGEHEENLRLSCPTEEVVEQAMSLKRNSLRSGGRRCRTCCPPWLLLSLLKGVDLMFHVYLLALLLFATYISVMLCHNDEESGVLESDNVQLPGVLESGNAQLPGVLESGNAQEPVDLEFYCNSSLAALKVLGSDRWHMSVADFLLIISIIHAACTAIAAIADTLYFLLIFNFNKYLLTVVPVKRLFLVVLLLLDAVVFVSTPGITLLTSGHFVIVLTVTAALYITLASVKLFGSLGQLAAGPGSSSRKASSQDSWIRWLPVIQLLLLTATLLVNTVTSLQTRFTFEVIPSACFGLFYAFLSLLTLTGDNSYCCPPSCGGLPRGRRRCRRSTASGRRGTDNLSVVSASCSSRQLIDVSAASYLVLAPLGVILHTILLHI